MSDLRIENQSQIPFQGGDNIKSKNRSGFGQIIKTAINKASSLEHDADKSIMNLMEGKAEVHESMIALQKADISMRLLLTVRNKAIEAYKEIMRMPF